MTDLENQGLILLIGEIKGTLDNVKTRVESIGEKVNSLPCVLHTSQIDILDNWKKNCLSTEQTEKIEQYKGNISLRNMVIIGVLTFLTGIALSVITNLLIR